MKTNSGRRFFLRIGSLAAGLGLLLLTMSTAPVATAHESPNDGYKSANSLVGTWWVTVTTFNCSTQVANKPFVSLLTFGADGSLIETTSSPAFAPGQRSTGHGIWQRLGRGTYRAVSEAFIQFGSNGPPPLQSGRQRIDQGIQMTSRDSFSSDAAVTFFDVYGSPLLTGCARASGVRFE
jgi:hypothetical protein